MKVLRLLLFLAAASGLRAADFSYDHGGIVRGPQTAPRLALEFSADTFTEGGGVILDTLKRHGIKAAFFLTGRCLRDPANVSLGHRILADGHLLGPHSDTHPLLCAWTNRARTLVTREFFQADLENNLTALAAFGVKRNQVPFFLPPYEYYNEEIVRWTAQSGLRLINFTSGTRATADYTENTASNFVSSAAILASIKNRESRGGLNGFLLLLHLGSGPGRTDKMADHLDELIEFLLHRGYQFVRVDELLNRPA